MQLKFNRDELIPAIIQDGQGQVLMLAYMNEESLQKTKETGLTWFYSRSRQQLWQKGESSGHVQRVVKIVADCDYDTLLITVEQIGPGACHEGHPSCFHYPLDGDEAAADTTFDPQVVYGPKILEDVYNVIVDRKEHPKEGSYTNYLLDKGLDKILKKVGEENAEVIIAAKNEDQDELIYEVSDLLYHLMVLLVEKGAKPKQIWEELKSRR